MTMMVIETSYRRTSPHIRIIRYANISHTLKMTCVPRPNHKKLTKITNNENEIYLFSYREMILYTGNYIMKIAGNVFVFLISHRHLIQLIIVSYSLVYHLGLESIWHCLSLLQILLIISLLFCQMQWSFALLSQLSLWCFARLCSWSTSLHHIYTTPLRTPISSLSVN